MMSIFLAVVVVGLLLTAEYLFDPNKTDENATVSYLRIVLIGVGVGLINYISPLLKGKAIYVAPVFLIAMVLVFVYLGSWWYDEGSSWKEMVPFLLLLIPLYFVAKSAAVMTTVLVSNGAIAKLILAIPAIAVILSVGYYIYDLFRFRYEYELSNNMGPGAAAAALALLLALAVAVTSVAEGGGFRSSTSNVKADEASSVTEKEALEEDSSEDETSEDIFATSEVEEPQGWGAHFYNLDLQDDGDLSNDFDFAPNRLTSSKDPDYYSEDFAELRGNDAANLVGACIAFDKTINTNYVRGILYNCKDKELKEEVKDLDRANAAIRMLEKDETLFRLVEASVNKLMRKAKKKEFLKMKGIKTQLFQNPATIDGIPDLVFYESEFDEGYCLVYTFQVKSGSKTEVPVAFHIKCGYQWCNAKLDTKPTKKPVVKKETSEKTTKKKTTKKKSSKKTSNKGSKKTTKKKTTTKKTTKKSKKTNKRPSTPKYNKDPKKAPKTNTEPNDDKGSGPNTNSGSGGNKSTKEQKENSNNKGSYEEYKKEIQNKNSKNESQGKGGDSNQSSTKPKSSNTNVTNNGDKGNGNGGADDKSKTSGKVKEAGSGKETNNDGGNNHISAPSD